MVLLWVFDGFAMGLLMVLLWVFYGFAYDFAMVLLVLTHTENQNNPCPTLKKSCMWKGLAHRPGTESRNKFFQIKE